MNGKPSLDGSTDRCLQSFLNLEVVEIDMATVTSPVHLRIYNNNNNNVNNNNNNNPRTDNNAADNSPCI